MSNRDRDVVTWRSRSASLRRAQLAAGRHRATLVKTVRHPSARLLERLARGGPTKITRQRHEVHGAPPVAAIRNEWRSATYSGPRATVRSTVPRCEGAVALLRGTARGVELHVTRFDRSDDEGYAIRDAIPMTKVFEVFLHARRGDAEKRRDLLGRASRGEVPEYLHLRWSQRSHILHSPV